MDQQPYLDSQSKPTTETLGAFVARVRRERSYGLKYLADQCGVPVEELAEVETTNTLPSDKLAKALDAALYIGAERLDTLLANTKAATPVKAHAKSGTKPATPAGDSGV